MDRATVYTSEQGRSIDFLFAQRATMIGLAKLSQAAFGSNTVVRGLAVTPNTPAALNVLVGIGEIYTMAQVDATTWGSLGSDTTDIILKQGLNMSTQTVSTPAPSTTGYSINYLIEAQYQDQDTNPVVLPFYNSNNPQQPLNGQGGNGAPLPSQRQGVCVIQAKAGVAATTGTQVTPSVDSGWTALAVVTVANGQSTVTSGNISIPAGVPQVSSLLQMMQTGSTQYAADTSTTANQITIALTPSIEAYTDGQPLNFQAANNNTGPCNINAGPGNIALNGAAGAFQGGEIIAGKFYEAVYRANTGTAVVIGQSGGALQVNLATEPEHAAQFGQISGVVGGMRNARMSVNAANAAATFLADEIIVETALGGLRYCLSGFNQTVNLTGAGAGGMDTGTGTAPASGYVALYAIYDPTTKTAALLATNATSSAVGNVYGGANMPTGYTASALVSVWPTSPSKQFMSGTQRDRKIALPAALALSTSTSAASFTVFGTSTFPPNAIEAKGAIEAISSVNSGMSLSIASDANGSGQQEVSGYATAPYGLIGAWSCLISQSQSLYYQTTNSSGTPTFTITTSGYSF